MKEGVVCLDRWSRPIRGAPSDPLKDDPEPETQRYLVETVWERRRWKSEIVEPWLMHNSRFFALCLFLLGLLMTLMGLLGKTPMTRSGSSSDAGAVTLTRASTFFFFSSTSEMKSCFPTQRPR